MNVTVIGIGYVGIITSVCFAEIGIKVKCFDNNEEKIKKLNCGIPTIKEKDLDIYLKKNKKRLIFSNDCEDCIKDADFIFICVGTPSLEDGSSDLSYIYSVLDNIKKYINKDLIVVIKSTVPIGTNDLVEKYLNEDSNYVVHVVSNPEFLSQGTAINDTFNASRIVVGTNDDYSKKMMAKLYKKLTERPYKIKYVDTTRRTAEMAKYACNSFLATKISFINDLANLCEKIDADIESVANIMGLDTRIGDKFLKSGIGFGGSCFPKDVKALLSTAKSYNEDLSLIESTLNINKQQKIRLIDKILKDFNNIEGIKVALLGCTFKPGTDDLRESPVFDNVDMLLKEGAIVRVYDPIDKAIETMKSIYGNKIKYYNNIDSCIKNTNIVIIITDHAQIVNYDLNNYIKFMNKPNIYDGRNCYKISEVSKYCLHYVSIGRKEVCNYIFYI